MPELKWREYDFVECLGILPERDEFFESHFFRMEKDDLVLEVTVWQYESVVAISLSQVSNRRCFITIYFAVRNKIEFVNEKNSAILRFCDIITVPNRFFYLEDKDVFDRDKVKNNQNLELCIYPHLELQFV